MFMPPDPSSVGEKKKIAGQRRLILLLQAMKYRLNMDVHLVVIKRQHNVRFLTEMQSLVVRNGWVGCCDTNHTSAGFPFGFRSMPSDVSSVAFCCSTARGEIILHSLTALPAWMGRAGADWG